MASYAILKRGRLGALYSYDVILQADDGYQEAQTYAFETDDVTQLNAVVAQFQDTHALALAALQVAPPDPPPIVFVTVPST